MKSGTPWSIKVDDEARERALEAARRADMSLSEWLQQAIAERASEEGVPPGPDRADRHGDDEAQALAVSVLRLTRRIKAMDADARSAIFGLKERLDEIEANLERVSRIEQQRGGSGALQSVTAMVNRLARELDNADETARSTVEGLRGSGRAGAMDSSITDAIRGLDARIAAMAERIKAPPPAPPRSGGSFEELRDRLDALLAGAPRQAEQKSAAAGLEATLRALETRIDEARTRIEERRGAHVPRDDEDRMHRIEARLADITSRLGGAAPSSGIARDTMPDLTSAIAEVAAQRVARAVRSDRASLQSDKFAAEALEALRAEIATLGERIDSVDRNAAEREPDRLALARHIEALAAEAPRDRDLLDEIRHEIEALGVSVDHVAREATILDRFDDLIRRLPDRTRLDALGEEISDLRRALERDDSPRAVSRLEMRVNELARNIETSLNARQSASEVAAAGMAASLADIRGALEDLVVSHGAGPDTAAIAGLAANLAEVRGAVEGLAPGHGTSEDSAVIAGLAAGLAEIREMLDVRENAGREQEDAAIGRLESRLDDIAERLDGVLAHAPAAELIDGLYERLEALAVSVETLNMRAVDPAALDAIAAEIAAIRGEIADREPPRLDYLESQIHDLAARLDAAAESDVDSEQLAELEERIAGLAADLDRVTPRTAVLQRVEENLIRLQTSLAEGRRESIEAARAAARDAVRELAEKDVDHGLLQALRRDLDQVRTAVGDGEALHGALDTVVDRLGRLEAETEARTAERSAETVAATGTFGPEPGIRRATPPAAPPAPPTGEGAAGSRQPDRKEAKSDLAALRELAASSAGPDRQPADRRAEFIAAARRAAQAAASEGHRGGRSEDTVPAQKPSPFARIGQAIRNRKKPLLLAAAAIVLAIGAVRMFGPQAVDPQQTLLSSPPPLVAAPVESRVATRAADGAPAPTVPRIDEPALVAPPANARTAMALASEAPIDGRFSNAFGAAAGTDASDVTGSVQPASATDAFDPDLPLTGSDKLRAAAAEGDPAAAFETANRFAEGTGTSRDLATAAKWYRQAAEHGLAVAQYRLASLYERGQGVDKDPGEAVKWYQRAADQGNVGAMHNLAVLMSEGAGGETDNAKALEWFLAAANYGVKDSQYNLGVMYARGLGRAPDLVEAYKWFAIAAVAGDTDAGARRDEITAMLNPDQLAAARAAAQAWRAKPVLAAANSVSAPEGGWDDDGVGVTAADQKQLVMKIQALLAEQGYDPGPADGIDGPKTREAVRAFQRTIGVAATGVIDGSLVTALAGNELG